MNNGDQDLILFIPCIVEILILISCIWAGIDSSKIELKKYKTSLSCSPFVLFLGCLLVWIIVFPWYLIVRGKIKSGTIQLKDGMSLSQPVITTEPTDSRIEKKCPHCAEPVLIDAKLCKHCGSKLDFQ